MRGDANAAKVRASQWPIPPDKSPVPDRVSSLAKEPATDSSSPRSNHAPRHFVHTSTVTRPTGRTAIPFPHRGHANSEGPAA